MKKTFGGLVVAAVLLLGACSEGEGNTVAEGNAAATEPQGTLADALGREQNGQFTRALQSAGLQQTLAGPGPYTVLVPTDPAFAKLPAGALQGLMAADARPQLTGVLTYHILPGTMLATDIGKAIDRGQGKAMLATMAGGTITATRDGDRIVLTDASGGRAVVTDTDRQHSNGVIHRIDTVLMPDTDAA